MTATFVGRLRALPLRLVSVVVVSLAFVGCAHADPRTRTSRALIGAGVATVVVGALIAGGCVDASEGDGCSGSPDGADVGAGMPVMAAGAAMIAGGIAVRAKDKGPVGKPLAPAATPFAVATDTSEERKPEGSEPGSKTYSPGPRIELLKSAP